MLLRQAAGAVLLLGKLLQHPLPAAVQSAAAKTAHRGQ
jgi:hypothetical protein